MSGPWHLDAEDALIGGQRGRLVADAEGRYVAYVINDIAAHSNLIAAAPELLAAAGFVLRYHDHAYDPHGSDCWICAKLRGPIAKAGGW